MDRYAIVDDISCPNLWLYFCICWRCCFRELPFQICWPLESDKFHLSSLICCYQQRPNGRTDRCGLVFRSPLKGKPLKLSLTLLIVVLWQMTSLGLLYSFCLCQFCTCRLAAFSSSVILPVVFTFVFASSPFLCGNLWERWVLRTVGTSAQCHTTLPGLITRHVICPLKHRYMAFSWQ